MKTFDIESLESLFEGMRDGVIFIDSDNRFSFLNKSAEKIVRMEAKDAIGKSLLICHVPRIKQKSPPDSGEDKRR